MTAPGWVETAEHRHLSLGHDAPLPTWAAEVTLTPTLSIVLHLTLTPTPDPDSYP